MQSKNYYIVLGVSSKASYKEIKSAYRILAKKFHPDKNPGNKNSDDHFKEIQYAYTILSNPEKRKKYDLKFSYGSAYQYTQQQAKRKTKEYKPTTTTSTPLPKNQYRTEINQIIISVVIALILLYFIVSY